MHVTCFQDVCRNQILLPSETCAVGLTGTDRKAEKKLSEKSNFYGIMKNGIYICGVKDFENKRTLPQGSDLAKVMYSLLKSQPDSNFIFFYFIGVIKDNIVLEVETGTARVAGTKK